MNQALTVTVWNDIQAFCHITGLEIFKDNALMMLLLEFLMRDSPKLCLVLLNLQDIQQMCLTV